jgi:hypothetical protein
VNEKYLTLYSDATSPTSFTFNSTTSNNYPLFSITIGSLSGNYIKFIYDGSAVDTFISVTSTGSVTLFYVNVTANSTTSPTVAGKAFIEISGGGSVSLTQTRFQTFKASAGVINMISVGLLLFEENIATYLTFSGNGVLILGNGTNDENSSVSIINSNFSVLNGSGLNGTVCRINGIIRSLVITGCNFGTSMIAGNGGALYLSKCNVNISTTNFNGCSVGAGGSGGAIYFGLETRFTLINSTFASCSSLYGGGIFSNSEETSERIMNGVNFTNNSVQSNGNGNDIADNSSVGAILYSSLNIINCKSNSSNTSTSNFYIIQVSGVYDCLFSTSGCSFDVMYVSVNGIDHRTCGTSSSPCGSLTQAVNNLNISNGWEADVIMGAGEYTNTVITIASINLVVYSNAVSRPALSLVAPPIGIIILLLLSFKFYVYLYFVT